MTHRDIAKLRLLLAKDLLDENEVCRILALSRSTIESTDAGSQYQMVKLYGDWLAHNKIYRNQYSHQLIDSLNSLILFYSGLSTAPIEPPSYDPGLFEAIANLLVEPLRNELNSFAITNNLPNRHFCLGRSWARFYFNTVNSILDRRIELSLEASKKAAQIHDSIKSRSLGTRLSTFALWFSIEQSYDPDKPGCFINWNIENRSESSLTNRHLVISGPIIINGRFLLQT